MKNPSREGLLADMQTVLHQTGGMKQDLHHQVTEDPPTLATQKTGVADLLLAVILGILPHQATQHANQTFQVQETRCWWWTPPS